MTDMMDEKRKTAIRHELETAGRRWHAAAKHPGAYGSCNEKTCYHTNALVSR